MRFERNWLALAAGVLALVVIGWWYTSPPTINLEYVDELYKSAHGDIMIRMRPRPEGTREHTAEIVRPVKVLDLTEALVRAREQAQETYGPLRLLRAGAGG